MIPINRTYAPLQAFVDELVRCGMRHAVTCPGSRNAPLALTLADDERLDVHSVIDERCAGFVALGMAKATRTPVAITTTSGSAAANLLPAAFEAREARVPLIVLTADRPPELRDVGAGQAIDQLKLYGAAAKWFVEVGSHEPSRATALHHRALACRAYWTAARGRPGVVHLNFPLREPLDPSPEELDPEPWQGRAAGGPWVDWHEPQVEARLPRLTTEVASARRGAIVCGPASEDLAEPAARLAAATGWPILAEPTSGVRCGRHDRSHVVAHYDVLLRMEAFAEANRPELVVRLGDTPTSKPLRAWLAETRQVVVDPHAAWHEPTRAAETIVHAPAAPVCHAFAEAAGEPDDRDWVEAWLAADALVPDALAEAPEPFEPKAWAALADAAPDDATLHVASSMPIRDVEAFFPQTAKPLRFLANRGANGIDGTVSTAAGAALSSGGARTYLLTGDLALVHDLGGLLAARRAGAELTIVCANNGGGAIFDFLPVAGSADRGLYERHIATPSGVDLARVAALADLPHREAASAREVVAAVADPGLVEVRTDRRRNVEWHRELVARVAGRL
jgi:2-succinyl-5-enolpyruvyl-6-hydroxy-3-cyclohexene-1-carboxylate synthase